MYTATARYDFETDDFEALVIAADGTEISAGYATTRDAATMKAQAELERLARRAVNVAAATAEAEEVQVSAHPYLPGFIVEGPDGKARTAETVAQVVAFIVRHGGAYFCDETVSDREQAAIARKLQAPAPAPADPNALIAEVVAAARATYEPTAAELAELHRELYAELAQAPAAPAPVLQFTAYTLPAPALVAAALAELARTAQQAGDAANAHALARAEYQLARGAYDAVSVAADGALLVPSKSDGGTVYRVGELPCTCTAGQNGRPCWHAAMLEAVFLARDVVAAELDADARARVVLAA